MLIYWVSVFFVPILIVIVCCTRNNLEVETFDTVESSTEDIVVDESMVKVLDSDDFEFRKRGDKNVVDI